MNRATGSLLMVISLAIAGSVCAADDSQGLPGDRFNVEREVMMAVKYSLGDETCYVPNDSPGVSASGMRHKRAPWVYPLMYGSELLAADCCFWGTFSAIPFLDAIGMSKPLVWVTAIGANSVASSAAVGLVGRRIFRARGSKTLAFVTTLAGGMANALIYGMYEEGDWESRELRDYVLLSLFVPALFTVVGYNLTGGK